MSMTIQATRMRGLTLVELLISVTLSVLLLTGVVSIFIANRESFNVAESLSRVQESIRYATTRINYDVSNAGFFGCVASSQTDLSVISTAPPANADGLGDFSRVVIGGESVGPNNSDRLTLHYARAETAVPYNMDMGGIPGRSGPGRADISGNSEFGDYEQNDIITISDCKCLMVARITAPPATSEFNHTGFSDENENCNLGRSEATAATIYKMEGVTYQLDPAAPIANADGQYVRRLMRTRLGGAGPQAILDGVEDFQVEYGIDADGDLMAEKYLDWNQVVLGGNRDNVASVRVTITVNSGKPVNDPLGLDPDFRKSSTFTVVLRNYGV